MPFRMGNCQPLNARRDRLDVVKGGRSIRRISTIRPAHDLHTPDYGVSEPGCCSFTVKVAADSFGGAHMSTLHPLSTHAEVSQRPAPPKLQSNHHTNSQRTD